jgi:hypothetical protein
VVEAEAEELIVTTIANIVTFRVAFLSPRVIPFSGAYALSAVPNSTELALNWLPLLSAELLGAEGTGR